MPEHITLTAEDGFKLAAYKATPAGAPRGGIVVIQEIFGVNQHMRKVTDGFAADGYAAVSPAVFDRAEKGFETGYTQADIDRGRATRGKCDETQLVMDVRAAVQHLAGQGLKVGVVGYCMGGTFAWLAATRIKGVAAAVGYYGGGIYATVGEKPLCPTILHFGETDASIPKEHYEAVMKAHPNVPSYVYPAGHGFNCDERGSWHAESAKLARERTIAFFRQHVG